jgi:DNA polymerase-1
VQPIETEDQSSMTSDDDQLGVAIIIRFSPKMHGTIYSSVYRLRNVLPLIQKPPVWIIVLLKWSVFLSLLMLMMPITYHSHDYEGAPEQLDREQILAQMKPILEDDSVQKIGHHLKYDAHIFANHGIDLKVGILIPCWPLMY